MYCAHCGTYIGQVPWQQHVCELCLRVIEGGAICSNCKQITYRPVGGLCPPCYRAALAPFETDAGSVLDDYDRDVMLELAADMVDFGRSESDGWFYSDDDTGVWGEPGVHEVVVED